MTFKIVGGIVDSGADKRTNEDVCPQDIKEFIDNLKPNEDITIEITSFGGSCTAGNAIVSMLRKASSEGHHTSSHVVSIAASMASVIACACDNLTIDSNAFLMVHLPYSHVEGNYLNMRKEADTLELVTRSLVSVYRTKFDLNDDQIFNMLEDETWILGSDAQQYGLKCKVIYVDSPLKIAASLKNCKYTYKNIPKGLKMTEKEENIEKMTEQVGIVEDPTVKDPTIEEKKNGDIVEEIVEKTVEEQIIEQLKNKISELEAKLAEYQTNEDEDEEYMISQEDCEKRVSGMQAKMQRQINNFINQLKARDEELAKAKANAISLKDQLDKSSNELSKMTSALVEKENALATLNACVNSPCETTDWRNLKGKEFWDFLKKHPEITKTNK